MGALEDLVAQLRGSQDDYMSQYLAASQAALEPKRNTPGNVLEQALVGGIPMLAGLFRGREGLAAGAQGAAVGLNVLGTQQKEEAENLQKQKLLEAQSSLDSFKSAREKLQELQITQAVEPFKNRLMQERQIEVERHKKPAQTNITNMAPMDTKAADKITSLQMTAESLGDLKAFIAKEFPEELKSGEGFLEVLSRIGKGTFNSGKEMELKSRIDEATSRLTEDLTTGAPSNFDAKKMISALTGGSLADIKLIDSRIDSYINRTNSFIDKFQKNQGYYAGKSPFQELKAMNAPEAPSTEEAAGLGASKEQMEMMRQELAGLEDGAEVEAPSRAALEEIMGAMPIGKTLTLIGPSGPRRIKRLSETDYK